MPTDARLLVDCRCTLGEGIVWSQHLRSLLWTDIEQSTLVDARSSRRRSRQWSLPDRLGSFAMCESGRLLLGLAKSLAFADLDAATGSDAAGRSDHADRAAHCAHPDQRWPDRSRGQLRLRHDTTKLRTRRLEASISTSSRPVFAASISAALSSRTASASAWMEAGCISAIRRRGRIRQCDYDADHARVGNVREFVRFKEGSGLPDGSSSTARDVCGMRSGAQVVVRRYDPDGTPARRDSGSLDESRPASRLGGDSLDQLFVDLVASGNDGRGTECGRPLQAACFRSGQPRLACATHSFAHDESTARVKLDTSSVSEADDV